MTSAERAALVDIQGYAGANRIEISSHARLRMAERHARYGDVREALLTAKICRAQDNGTWRVDGEDLDGDGLTIIVAIEGRVIVVTIF
jgi:hypothetical protein